MPKDELHWKNESVRRLRELLPLYGLDEADVAGTLHDGIKSGKRRHQAQWLSSLGRELKSPVSADVAPPQAAAAEYWDLLNEYGVQRSEIPHTVPPESERAFEAQVARTRELFANAPTEQFEAWKDAAKRHTVNDVVSFLSDRVTVRARELGFFMPCPSFFGCFPISSFNAQCTLRNGSALMLVDLGALSLIEMFVGYWGWDEDSVDRSLQPLEAMRRYVQSGLLPDQSAWSHRCYQDAAWLLAYTHLVSDAERFLIAHELGHLLLGHTSDQPLHAMPAGNRSVAVRENLWEQEFQADRFALMMLLPEAYDRLRIRQATAAPYVVLGIAQLHEELSRSYGRYFDTHPPATDRLRAIEEEIDKASLVLDADLGPKFISVIDGCRILLPKSPAEIAQIRRLFGEQ